MNTHQLQPRGNALRLGGLLAAVAITAVLVGSQLAIADGYATRADALLAAKESKALVQQTAASASRRTRS